jgi:hypothetical protein
MDLGKNRTTMSYAVRAFSWLRQAVTANLWAVQTEVPARIHSCKYTSGAPHHTANDPKLSRSRVGQEARNLRAAARSLAGTTGSLVAVVGIDQMDFVYSSNW